MNDLTLNDFFARYFCELDCDRLSLRPLSLDDARDMYAYTSNPLSSRFLKWDVKTLEETKQFVLKSQAGYAQKNLFLWGVFLKEPQKLIGAIHLYNISLSNYNGEISYIINPEFSNCGYATEAVKRLVMYTFLDMGLKRIQALCVPENGMSERVMIKAGFQFEGELKSACYIKGEFKNLKLYGQISCY